MIFASAALLSLILLLSLLYRLQAKCLPLSYRILIGMGLGISYGLLLRFIPHNAIYLIIKGGLDFIGHGYLVLLKMLVIPLVFTSLTYAILNLAAENDAAIKKMSVLTCTLLLCMTAVSSLITLFVGKMLAVGEGMHLPDFSEVPKHTYTGLVDSLLGILPNNLITIMSQENTAALVIFTVLFAVASRMMGEKEPEKLAILKQFFSALFAAVNNLTKLVLVLSPYGILALMASLLFNQGIVLLLGMMNFIIAMYLAMGCVLVMHSLILFFFGYPPIVYFKKAFAPLFVAFTTRSSLATLPVTQENLDKEFKTSQMVSTFVPGIGASIGMNACAGVFPAMLVMMTLTILHQTLTPHLILMIIFINAIASLGISGIPGTAYIAATVTLTSLNLPYAIVALVQGIDPIIDMGRTAVNVNGVITTALVVNRVMQAEPVIQAEEKLMNVLSDNS